MGVTEEDTHIVTHAHTLKHTLKHTHAYTYVHTHMPILPKAKREKKGHQKWATAGQRWAANLLSGQVLTDQSHQSPGQGH